MSHPTSTLVFCLLAGWIPPALGFSSDSSPLTRGFERTVALTNSTMVVSVTVTNTGTNTLRGFWYSDQVPAGLAVNTLSVTVDGRAVTNYVLESGQPGDVTAGCAPYRWVLETPPAFSQTNPIPPQTAVKIVWSFSSATPGDFNLQQFFWAGYDPASSNFVFGHSDTVDQEILSFLSAPPPPASLASSGSTSGPRLQLDGFPGASYLLEASTNLQHWFPLVTNTAPFSFIDTDSAYFSRRFYRGLWLP